MKSKLDKLPSSDNLEEEINFAMIEKLNELSKTPKILNFFMKDKFIDQADIEDQYTISGISNKIIYEKLTKLLN